MCKYHAELPNNCSPFNNLLKRQCILRNMINPDKITKENINLTHGFAAGSPASSTQLTSRIGA